VTFYVFLYFVVVLFAITLAFVGVKTKKRVFVYLSLALAVVAIGTRVNIGADYENYCDILNSLTFYDFGIGTRFSIEYGFWLISGIGAFFGNICRGFFFISAAITLVFFYNLYRRTPNLLPIGIFIFFFSLPYGFVINTVRQGIAVFAFLNGVLFMSNQENLSFRSFLGYSLWVAIGCLFHSSTIILIVFYPFFCKKVWNLFNAKILCVVAISGLVINMTFNLVGISIDSALTQYSQMLRYFSDSRFAVEKGDFGLGTYLTLLSYLVPLAFYDRVTAVYSKSKVWFIMFAFGTALKYAFPGNMFVTRVAFFFMFAEVLVFPYFFRHQAKQKKYLLPIVLVLWFFVLYYFDFPEFVKTQVFEGAHFLGISI